MSRHLRPLFTCEEIWCRLFSEPGAGSDVAGLSTAAVRDGDPDPQLIRADSPPGASRR